MFSSTFLLLYTVSWCQSYLLRCDFESPCLDFQSDSNWGLTDGLHPYPIDHDHTLNISSGHYLFYNSQTVPRFPFAEIKTTAWLHPPTDRAICFQMWYYTSKTDLPFSIQLVQGDDEILSRVIASIPGKDPSINDWTPISIQLPGEQIKIVIRLNVTTQPLTFDDLTVDYCDLPRPTPLTTLFTCDFESTCNDSFVSLPLYPYQWSTIEANDAQDKESQAPKTDYTFGNSTGHYAWLGNLNLIQAGRVGYFATKSVFNFTANDSYCLNFQYYGYGNMYNNHLQVLSMTNDESPLVQVLWPKPDAWAYK
jgi:hypothetical protein